MTTNSSIYALDLGIYLSQFFCYLGLNCLITMMMMIVMTVDDDDDDDDDDDGNNLYTINTICESNDHHYNCYD